METFRLTGQNIIRQSEANLYLGQSTGFEIDYGVPREDSMYQLKEVFPLGFLNWEEIYNNAFDLVESMKCEGSIGGLVIWKRVEGDNEDAPFVLEVWRNISFAGESNP